MNVAKAKCHVVRIIAGQVRNWTLKTGRIGTYGNLRSLLA